MPPDATDTSSAHPAKAETVSDAAGRIALAWIAPVVAFGLIALLRRIAHAQGVISDYFFFNQDLGVLACATLALLMICLPQVTLAPARIPVLEAVARRRGL